jgi:hypothetical protein
MRRRLGFIVLLSLATWSSAACHRPPPDPRVGPSRSEIAIRVVNRSVSDLVINLVQGGLRTRLGTSYGGMTNVFFLPWERLRGSGTMRLLGHPVGSSVEVVTDQLSVRPGSMVVWSIEPVLAQSSAAVY